MIDFAFGESPGLAKEALYHNNLDKENYYKVKAVKSGIQTGDPWNTVLAILPYVGSLPNLQYFVQGTSPKKKKQTGTILAC